MVRHPGEWGDGQGRRQRIVKMLSPIECQSGPDLEVGVSSTKKGMKGEPRLVKVSAPRIEKYECQRVYSAEDTSGNSEQRTNAVRRRSTCHRGLFALHDWRLYNCVGVRAGRMLGHAENRAEQWTSNSGEGDS